MKRKAITITLPQELLELIKDFSIVNKRNLSYQIELLLEEALEGMKQDEKDK